MFYDPYAFPFTRMFEEHWPGIRDELRGLQADVLALQRAQIPLAMFVGQLEAGENGWTPSWQAGTADANAQWLTYAIRYLGRFAKGAAEKLPLTTSLLSRVNGCHVAAFSRLKASGVVGAHTHPELRASGILIYHLGIDLTPGKSYLSVNGEARPELPGRSLVFDGSFEHAAVNTDDRDRTILYMEFAAAG